MEDKLSVLNRLTEKIYLQSNIKNRELARNIARRWLRY